MLKGGVLQNVPLFFSRWPFALYIRAIVLITYFYFAVTLRITKESVYSSHFVGYCIVLIAFFIYK